MMESSLEIKWYAGKVVRTEQRAAQKAVMHLAHEIQRDAQKIVPKDTGTLEGSATTEPLGAGRIGARISFGGPASAYAARQHEEMGWSHGGGRQAKYLETPFKAKAPLAPPLIEAAVKAALRGGGL